MSLFKCILVILVYFILLFGYGMNFYKLCQNDFEAPYKPEIIRVLGVVTGLPGVIMGFMTFDDEKSN